MLRLLCPNSSWTILKSAPPSSKWVAKQCLKVWKCAPLLTPDKIIYLENIDYKRAITILRQCLRLYNYYIKSKEKYFNGDKLIIYQILPINKEPKKKESVDKTCIISFD